MHLRIIRGKGCLRNPSLIPTNTWTANSVEVQHSCMTCSIRMKYTHRSFILQMYLLSNCTKRVASCAPKRVHQIDDKQQYHAGIRSTDIINHKRAMTPVTVNTFSGLCSICPRERSLPARGSEQTKDDGTQGIGKSPRKTRQFNHDINMIAHRWNSSDKFDTSKL